MSDVSSRKSHSAEIRQGLFIPFLLVLIASITLVGWLTENYALVRLVDTFPAMSPMTAILFVLLGAALGIKYYTLNSTRLSNVPIFFTLVIFLFSFVHLTDTMFFHALNLNTLLFPTKVASISAAMAPATAVCFLLFSIALLIEYLMIKIPEINSQKAFLLLSLSIFPVILITLFSLFLFITELAVYLRTEFFLV